MKQDDWRLKIVVFICGGVLMGLEMAGSRVLAIHFGSSIYVWGAIISVFLAALAGGYYSGGIIADRKPTFLLLNVLVLIGGCWLLVIPLYANWVCRGVRHVNPGERLNPLIATVLLFGGPSVLLGMVSPFAVRLAARSLEKIGNLSGSLYALSTVGSIAGTLITAFWLIPLMGVRMLLQALGLVLIALTLVVIPKSRKLILIAMPLGIFVVSMLLLPSFRPRSTRQNENVVFEGDSAYHHIQVVDNPVANYRNLHFNSYTESGISLTAPNETLLAYTDAFQLGRIFRPSLERVLIIGGGGGAGARKFVTDDPKVVVDVVEIDPVVVDLGYRFFYLKNSERLQIHTEDGRGFVRRTTNRYDLVVLDAYTIGGQIPFHLTTQEFMSEIAAILKPGGVVLANIHSALEGVRSRFLHAEYKTLSTVFPELHLFALGGVPPGEHDDVYLHRRRNVILVALTDSRAWTKEQITAAADRLVAENIVKTLHFTSDARQLLNRPLNTDDVPLLTDDYAPVDTMLF